jgi:lipocalin
VVNKGYNPDRGMWQKTDGVAYFTGEPTRAALKVSFFGPFYGGYNVIALDKDYRYALVCGPDRDYLWLLARAENPARSEAADAGYRHPAGLRRQQTALGQSAY